MFDRWDDYDRAEALALVAHEREACTRCGQTGLMRREDQSDDLVTWTDGTRVLVEQYRCLGCMALELINRDRSDADHKHVKGQYSPEDGVRRVAIPKGVPRG